MPIYNYACDACGNEFEEIILTADDPDVVECPSCAHSTLEGDVRRLPTRGSTFRLEGSGWYADGYASPRKKDAQDQS